MQMIERQQLLPHVIAIADLFLERFNPESPMETAKFQEKLEALTLAIGRTVNDETELSLLSGMLDAVKATRRTNLYLPNRYALALRLDPEHLGHGTVGLVAEKLSLSDRGCNCLSIWQQALNACTDVSHAILHNLGLPLLPAQALLL